MQTQIDITAIGKGHKTLICETDDPVQVEEVVAEITKKVNQKFIVYGKEFSTLEAVEIPKNKIREFVLSDKYYQKVVIQPLGGG